MDYEQRYKEALDEAKAIHKAIKQDLKPVIEQIFPELKESEDEKIRKELTDYIKKKFESSCSPTPSKNILANWITWLEKQGQNDSQVLLPSFTFDDILALQCCMETVKKVQEDKDLYEKLKDLHDRVYDAYQLEKQKDNADKVELKDYNIDPHFSKPIDKVEPKFKVGDWVVFNGLTLYINEVVKGYYRTISKSGTPNSYDWNIDNAARLWTIKDAKDGDVLFHSDSASNGIFIFKELLKYEFGEKVICYCDYDSEDHFCLGEHHTCCWADAKILHPATKEQRETLFEKMKLEGYRWDENEKKVIRFERFVRREESDFAFKEDENES